VAVARRSALLHDKARCCKAQMSVCGRPADPILARALRLQLQHWSCLSNDRVGGRTQLEQVFAIVSAHRGSEGNYRRKCRVGRPAVGENAQTGLLTGARRTYARSLVSSRLGKHRRTRSPDKKNRVGDDAAQHEECEKRRSMRVWVWIFRAG